MSRENSPRGPRFPLSIIPAAMGACAVVDLCFVIIAAPSLLMPSRLHGLFQLLLSSIILYAIIGIVLSGYLLVVRGFMRIFRYRPGPIAAFVMVVSFPLWMISLETLQAKILGTYIGLRSPLFLMPIGIALVILLAATGIAVWMAKRVGGASEGAAGRFGFGRQFVLFAVLFIIAGLLFGHASNVLGVINLNQERSRSRERVVDPLPEASEDAPNVVIAVIECIRSDHFTPENMPFLWKLARENIYFSRYYTAAPATRPSVTSFFLSLYPAQHGCYNLAGGKTSDGTRMRVRAPESAVSFPGLMQDHGYRTLMVTSNSLVMDRVFGFERIFNRFSASDPYHFRAPCLEPFRGFQFLEKVFDYFRLFKVLVFSPEHSTTYFDAPRLNSTIRRDLKKSSVNPFLLYVHYIEPHSPYYAHPYRPMQVNLYLPFQRDRLLDYYRQELRAADTAVENLYDYLDESGLLENTWLFVTADHGEEFYDHGDWGHGKSLYPEVVHVPAILVPPQGAGRPVRIDRPVDNIDIAPTLVELAGIEPDSSWEGVSLARLFDSAPHPGDTPLRRHPVMSQFDDGQRFFASVVEGDYQLILRSQHGDDRYMLFDLQGDPAGTRDLFGTGIGMEDSLRHSLDRELERLFDSAGDLEGESEPVDEELMKQLKTLGYVD